MQAFDASSIIHAWDHYPFEQFPPLWRWLEGQLNDESIVISAVAYDEVKKVSPDCWSWMKDSKISRLPVDGKILAAANQIKCLLGIIEDKYKGGVGENDIFIVATSKVYKIGLVSNEGKQTTLPKVMADYRIPAVCALKSVKVPCFDFREYLIASRTVFR